MKKVTEIVGTNIPILEAIDLSENRLHGLDGVVSLLQKAPNTKLLYLARNKVLFSKRKILFQFFGREIPIDTLRSQPYFLLFDSSSYTT